MNIVTEQAIWGVDTASFFAADSEVSSQSPIDAFIDAVLRINDVCTDPRQISNELAQLMVLGYVSAVESFIRSLIRQIINVDVASEAASHRQQVSFAAATYHEGRLLPEALLEHISFIETGHIAKSLSKFLGFDHGRVQKALGTFGPEFDKVCQLRHCIVHRFGRLGSQNALALGFESHSQFLERTVSLGYDDVQKIADVCDNTARAINNYCYEEVLWRSYRGGWVEWSGDLRKDRATYRRYYSVFASARYSPASPALRAAYNEFRATVLTS